MAGTTTNNGWDYPTSTDLVKDGALNIQTLAQDIDTSVGTGLLAWTAWTPTLSGMSLGNGTATFRYAKLGKTVHIRGLVTFGTTSTMTGPLDISLPLNISSTGYGFAQALGNASYYSTLFYGCLVFVGNLAYLRPVVYNAAGTYATSADLSATVPFTWNNGKTLMISATYETA